ncbi:MAG: NADPH-dependent oxidoreductase, partial [Scardovia wiggsiae]
IMHYYKAMRDADGRYRGVNEWVLDVWPVVEAYIKRTGQKLVPDGNAGKADAASSASVSGPGTQDDGAEAISSASVSDASSAAGSEPGIGVIGGAGGSADAGSSASVS